jgi:hypothetical protein
MIVPSIITYSKSGSPDNALKIKSKTPFCAQRRKRRKTEFQFPKADGRSRQGAPVRATHKTASTKSRLSVPLRPGSPSLPGRTGASRSHCASLKTLRSKAILHLVALNQISRIRGIPPPKTECPQALGGSARGARFCMPCWQYAKARCLVLSMSNAITVTVTYRTPPSVGRAT